MVELVVGLGDSGNGRGTLVVMVVVVLVVAVSNSSNSGGDGGGGWPGGEWGLVAVDLDSVKAQKNDAGNCVHGSRASLSFTTHGVGVENVG